MSTTGDCLNINVGVLGHVDSGKTSLVEKLSTVLSTSALDKHPQSQERGITLDLGFSAFQVPAPQWLSQQGYHQLQFTLVDCPGHASLVRTVLGGAHIMDTMLLIIDVTEGIQLQTAECLVIGEMTVKSVLVVLNKVDLIPEDKREKILHKAVKRVTQTLKLTSFETFKIVSASAKTGIGIEDVIHEMTSMIRSPPERKFGPFLFSIDHCFRIKGQGTILTGTVLQGSVAVHDVVEFPVLKEIRKIKSIQMFKKAVSCASAGDRIGLCVTHLDPSRLERGIASSPGTVSTFQMVIISAVKVRFYTDVVKSGQKFNVMLGHTATGGRVTFLHSKGSQFSIEEAYEYAEELPIDRSIWALIVFDVPVTAPLDLSVVAARLDAGSSEAQSCRLALHGRIECIVEDIEKLRVYKIKTRHGRIKQWTKDNTIAICTGMFKKETDFSLFKGMQVMTEEGHRGKLQGPHGQDGDFVIRFSTPAASQPISDTSITLYAKKYITLQS